MFSWILRDTGGRGGGGDPGWGMGYILEWIRFPVLLFKIFWKPSIKTDPLIEQEYQMSEPEWHCLFNPFRILGIIGLIVRNLNKVKENDKKVVLTIYWVINKQKNHLILSSTFLKFVTIIKLSTCLQSLSTLLFALDLKRKSSFHILAKIACENRRKSLRIFCKLAVLTFL
jgi:hypothetical protein